MPTDKMEVGNLTFTDPKTGQETRINTIATLTMATDDTSQFEPIKALEEPKELTGTLEIATTNLVMKILKDILYKSFTVTGTLEEIARDCHGAKNGLSMYQSKFVILWDSTIKKQDLDKYGWEANPFVWVIEFEKVEVNNEKD